MPGDELDEEESLWARRLEESYQRAVSDEDQRGMQAAAKAGLSHVRQRRTERKAAAKAASDACSGADDGKISIGSLDEFISVLDQVPPDPIDQAKLKEALARCRAINRLDGLQIFFKMIECPGFAEALTDFATSWQPPTKGEDDATVQTETARAN
jgi:hypothetical protein